MHVSDTIRYVGVNDHEIDLFEGQYSVPKGMCYNSYLLLDDKIAVLDTVDARFGQGWLESIRKELGGRKPDYLILQHMEPDHSANAQRFLQLYPDATVVGSAIALKMLRAFFPSMPEAKTRAVKTGDTLPLGRHTLTFVEAPMVHWPEVIVTYEASERVLFSADAFGKFGALDAQEDWLCEARRYYIGIVGKYGMPVQALLGRAKALDIQTICPLHGPALRENLGYYLGKYDAWSRYAAEDEGIVIAYTSIYGHTKEAAEELHRLLTAQGKSAVLFDLARCDMHAAVAEAFRYSALVLATTTYNADVFPHMRQFIDHLVHRGFRGRRIGLIENGSWAPVAAKVMQKALAPCKDLTFVAPAVTIRSALDEPTRQALEDLAAAL